MSKVARRSVLSLCSSSLFVFLAFLFRCSQYSSPVLCFSQVFSAEVAATFADMEREVVNASRGYEVVCCSGLSVDLMINVANDLKIELQVRLTVPASSRNLIAATFTRLITSIGDPCISHQYVVSLCHLPPLFQVYLVTDGTFGAPRTNGWTGVVGDLLDGSADLSFAPLSVTAQRARRLDFSDPYFFSSISILSSTKYVAVQF